MQMQLSLETSALQNAYDKAFHQVEVVHESENARKLRLQILLLEDENDDLHHQLMQADGFIDDLEHYTIDLQEDLEAVMGRCDLAQGDLRIRNREIETLKVNDTILRHRRGLIFLIGGVNFSFWSDHGFYETAHREAHACTRAFGP